MSRLPKDLSARDSLFLYVHSHPQLQYFLNVAETRRAANRSGLFESGNSPRLDNVVEIHPLTTSRFAQHR